MQQGDNIKMYMTFADDNGWIYRGVIEDITIGDKNEPVREQHYQAEADIYDTNGTLLFRAEKY